MFKEYEVLFLFGDKKFIESNSEDHQFLLSLNNPYFNFIIDIFNNDLILNSNNNQNHKYIMTKLTEDLVKDIKFELKKEISTTDGAYELILNQIYIQNINDKNDIKIINLKILKNKYDFIQQLKNKQNNKIFISNNDYEFEKNTGNYILDNMN